MCATFNIVMGDISLEFSINIEKYRKMTKIIFFPTCRLLCLPFSPRPCQLQRPSENLGRGLPGGHGLADPPVFTTVVTVL